MEPGDRLHILSRSLVLALALLTLGSAGAGAKVLLTQKQALELAFPSGTEVERRSAFLTGAQVKAAETAARAKLPSALWTYYIGRSGGRVAGYAYFESHPVRTMDETFMVVVDPAGAVLFVEILAFAEPDEYLASKRWLKQFPGRALDDELLLRRGLKNITGATLTAEAVTAGVRRVLAVHQVLHPK